MKILALTKYSYEGPSSRYRFYNYQKCFLEHGIALSINPLFGGSYFSAKSKIKKICVTLWAYLQRVMLLISLLLPPRKYDLLLIEYELFPYAPAWFEWLLRKRGIKYIVDYDDAIFHKYDMHSSGMMRKLLGGKIGNVMRYAECVIVCNAYLETYAKRFNAHTLRLPTVVLLERYQKAMDEYKSQDNKPFVIGWIGSKSTSVYILEILPAIRRFVDICDDVRFDLVGFDASLLSQEEANRYHINIIQWSEKSEVENILGFDVGIMPLRDDPWSRGKCGFKLVQYMSCSKPVVASPVGMNVSLVEEGKNGFLVLLEDEWLKAFETLYSDKELRKSMGEKNFSKIHKEYHHVINCESYVRLIQEIFAKEKM